MFPREVLVNKHAQIFDIVFALQRNVHVGIAEVVNNFQIDLVRYFFLSGTKDYEIRFFKYLEIACLLLAKRKP